MLKTLGAETEALLDEISDGFLAVDRDWRILFLNRTAEPFFGAPRQRLVGRNLWEVFPASLGTDYARVYQEAMETGRMLSLETAHPATGQWFHIRAHPLPHGLAIFYQDITAWKRSEAEREEGERHFRHLADSAPVLIWMSGLEKEGLYFNESWLRYRGRTLEEELGSGWLEGVHPDDADRLSLCQEAFERREPFTTQFRLRRADGAYRWMLDTGVPRHAEDGSFSGYIGSCVDITDRLEAEQALQGSEAKFRGLFESNVLPMGYWHEDGRLLDANEAYLALTHYTREELEAGLARWDTLTPPEYRELDQRAVDELLSGRASSSPYEKEYVLRDGTRVPVLVARSLLPGHTDRGVGVVVDLTQQKQAEEALRASEERYRWLVETISESVWRFELEQPVPTDLPEDEQIELFYRHGYLAEANEGTARLYGYASAEAMQGMKLAELLIPEDPANREYLRAFIRCGYRLVDAESVEQDQRGRRRYFLNNLVGTVEDGMLLRAWGASRDVTERRQAEEELRINRERLDLVLRSVDLGLWYCDLPFDRLEWNDRCKEHFGLPVDAEVTIGMFFQRLHPDDREPTRLGIERAIQEGTVFDHDYRTVDDQGRVRWIRAIGSAFYDASGTARRFDGITVDVTEQRRTLEQLAEADQRKNDFLAMLAHELRNPLSPIVNSVQILRLRSSGDPVIDRHRDIIERQVRHMARLIDDLLDVSRINLGKVELRLQAVDFRAVVQDAVEAARPAVDARKQELYVQVPGTEVPLHADAARLQQVVSNLLNNASKFTPPGGRIELSLKREPGEPGAAVLRVRDTGIGMEPQLCSRVFELFAQGDQGLARSEGGLGIGLTMVRNLVDMHGGTVRAHSEGPGFGSEFEVRLPLCPAPAAPSPFNGQAGGLLANGIQPVRSVLVVDDNPDARETLAEMLSGWGYDVRTAPDGPAALAAAAELRPDVVLLDIGMPGMDGYEVATRLNRGAAGSPVLVALTGYGQEDYRRRAAEAGFRHHLTKPVPPEELRAFLSGLHRPAEAVDAAG